MTGEGVGRRVAAWVWAFPPKARDVSGYVRSATVASLGIWVIVAAGAALRWYRIDAESLWLDEIASYQFAVTRYDSALELVLTEPVSDPHPPLYYLLLRWWTDLFGTTGVAMRSMSVVFGLVTVLVTYLLAVKLFDRRLPGLVASALVAVSAMHVYLGQEARMYTLLTMLTALSFYWYVDVVFAEGPSRASVSRYVVATVLLGYTHTFAVFLILAQNVFVALQARRDTGRRLRDPFAMVRESPLLRRWVGTQAVVAVLLAPWLVLLVAHAVGLPIVDQGDTDWIPASSLFYLFGTVRQYLFYNIDDLLVPGHGWLVWVAILIAIAAGLRFRPDADPDDDVDEIELEASDRSLMLAVWLVVPIVTPYVLGYVFDPIYRHKYTIGASLAFFVMIGYGVTKLRDNYGRVAPAAIVVLLLVGTVAPMGTIYHETQKPEWRSAMGEFDEKTGGEVLVVTSPGFVDGPIEYYADDGVTVRSVPPNATWNGTFAELLAGWDRVWFVFSNWYLSESRSRSLASELAEGGFVIDSEAFDPWYYEVPHREVERFGVRAYELYNTTDDPHGAESVRPKASGGSTSNDAAVIAVGG